MTYKDMTFCASLTCKGKCNRRLTKEDQDYINKNSWERISMADFCDENGNPKNLLRNKDETIQNKNK